MNLAVNSSINNIKLSDDETLDQLAGELKFIQPRQGYRFSIDAVLVSFFIGDFAPKVIDLGTGCGVIPMLLVKRGVVGKVVGVEVQERLFQMAGRNVEINQMQSQVEIWHLDLRQLKDICPANSYDLVVTNPPFRKIKSGRINPRAEKAIARHEVLCSLEELAQIASFLIRPKGKLVLIYPASRLADMIYTMRSNNLEPRRLRMVHSNPNSGAKLILLECCQGGGVQMEVEKPLYIYQKENIYTEEVNRMLLSEK